MLAFSKGHWENPEEAHGDKRVKEDFQRWRRLAAIGGQAERYMLSEQAKIVENFKGKGKLEPIEEDAVTLRALVESLPNSTSVMESDIRANRDINNDCYI
ncbi:hypothetical protein BCR34DRAFT_579536 [Clohesyomyces aquaticus]|uniref:Uncharacterized protein n=1 Tax=Clohesyomyces aquaticus TaxID=1231657 RepID=A0A1Y1YAM3_9PLEO|nr:hypothetical protein BCR34DRAFT_579536 [Clohesyomyces aquaticus]